MRTLTLGVVLAALLWRSVCLPAGSRRSPATSRASTLGRARPRAVGLTASSASRPNGRRPFRRARTRRRAHTGGVGRRPMTILSWRAGLAVAVLVFSAYAAAQPATPQQQEGARQQTERNLTQPYNNAPRREVRSSTSDPGSTQLGDSPGAGSADPVTRPNLEQARVPLALIGGLLVALAMVSLGGFYAWRGSIPVGESEDLMKVSALLPGGSICAWTMAIVWGDSRHHRIDHYLRQGAAAADHWPHALFMAGGGGRKSAQLRWTDSDRRRRVDDHPVPAVQLAQQGRFHRQPDGHEYPSGKFNGGEKMVFWFAPVLFTPLSIASVWCSTFRTSARPGPRCRPSTASTWCWRIWRLRWLACTFTWARSVRGAVPGSDAQRARHREWAKHRQQRHQGGSRPKVPWCQRPRCPELFATRSC